MIKIIVLIVFFFTFPLVIIYLCKRWNFFKKLGSVVIAYGFGILLSITGIIPEGSEAYKVALEGRIAIPSEEAHTLLTSGTISEDDIFVNRIASTQDIMISVIIPLAFPLLLFSLNIKRWLKYAKEGFFSMFLALVSVIVIIFSGYFIFKNIVPDCWKIGGMLVGVYTGGTPNLVSLKLALDVEPNLFIMTNTYDMMTGAATIIFFITLGPSLFRKILPPFKYVGRSAGEIDGLVKETETFEDYSGMFRKGVLANLLKALGIAILIFTVSVGISMLLPQVPQMVVVILSITTFSIVASLIRWVNNIEKTFQLGMYFILVFSLAVASMADLGAFFNIGMLGLFLFVTWAYFGSLVLHFLLSKIFKIDADNFLITTTALVFSPPFVPIVAGALKNKEVIITGITVGICGYLIGNYAGVAMGYFLRGL